MIFKKICFTHIFCVLYELQDTTIHCKATLASVTLCYGKKKTAYKKPLGNLGADGK